MVLAGDRVVIFAPKSLDDDDFASLLAAIVRKIDEEPDTSRKGILYDIPSVVGVDARKRQAMAEMLAARRMKRARIVAGFVLVTPSSVVRGLATGVFWLSPPPHPWAVMATLHEGFRWLAERLPPGIDIVAVMRGY